MNYEAISLEEAAWLETKLQEEETTVLLKHIREKRDLAWTDTTAHSSRGMVFIKRLFMDMLNGFQRT